MTGKHILELEREVAIALAKKIKQMSIPEKKVYNETKKQLADMKKISDITFEKMLIMTKAGRSKRQIAAALGTRPDRIFNNLTPKQWVRLKITEVTMKMTSWL